MERTLSAFLAVTRTGNLTAAADAIGLTQPALTKTIRRLEADLGAQLFVRTARGMVLTEAGDMFLAHARAIETHWAQAREEADARAGGGLAEFHIATGAAYHFRIVPLLIRRLSTEFPETRFTIEFDVAGRALAKLSAGEIHLLLGAFVQEVPEGVVTEKLLEVATTAFCDAADPLATAGGPVPPSALRGRPWVIFKRDTFMRQRLTEYCLRHMLPLPHIVTEVDSLLATMMIVAETQNLTAAPVTLEPMARTAGLAMVNLDVPLWGFPSGAWMRAGTREYPILRRALTILRELCSAYNPELLRTPE